MRDRLFPFLLLLTLLDVAFVQTTGIVSGLALLPMWVLAGASPLLRQMQRVRAYRVVWNTAVLILFAVLAHHASTTGLLYMLEDGLLLAILCQVHLLNNVGERQRPDLVFFNSFLVAFVTSFFAPDLSWSLLFVGHAFVLVPALQVSALIRRGTSPDRGLLFTVLRDSGRRVFAISVSTAVLFVVLPRDFAAHGWLDDVIAPRSQAGISDRIRLDDEFPVRLGNQVVMRLEPTNGNPDDVPSHWRAVTFSRFDGMTWLSQDAARLDYLSASDPPWRNDADGLWQRDIGKGQTSVRVRLHNSEMRHLPSPLTAQSLRLLPGAELALDPRPYGVFAFQSLDAAPGATVEYEVSLAASSGTVRITNPMRQQLSELPISGLPAIVHDLAARLREELSQATDDESAARATCEWLRDHRRYQLPGGPGFARSLTDFLVGTGAGHCEYFATALALLLRLRGMPCRVVGGYLAHEWDPSSRSVLVRAQHAHAWVEALRRDGTWITLDPTPPADLDATYGEQTSWFGGVWNQLGAMWRNVVGFDQNMRSSWLQKLADHATSAGRAIVDRPWVPAAAVMAVVVLILRRRRRQHAAAIIDLDRAIRAAGLSLQAGETPRELLARAAAASLAPVCLARLEAAAGRHERQRYGNEPGR